MPLGWGWSGWLLLAGWEGGGWKCSAAAGAEQGSDKMWPLDLTS